MSFHQILFNINSTIPGIYVFRISGIYKVGDIKCSLPRTEVIVTCLRNVVRVHSAVCLPRLQLERGGPLLEVLLEPPFEDSSTLLVLYLPSPFEHVALELPGILHLLVDHFKHAEAIHILVLVEAAFEDDIRLLSFFRYAANGQLIYLAAPLVILEFADVLEERSLRLHQRTFPIPHIVLEASLIGHLAECLASVPVSAITMTLVGLDFALVFVTVAESHDSTSRCEGIVGKGAVVSTAIGEDHLPEALEGVLEELSAVQDALAGLAEPVLTSSLHLVVLEVARVLVHRLVDAHAPPSALALMELSRVLVPYFLTLRDASLSLRLRLFWSHHNRLQDLLQIGCLRHLSLNFVALLPCLLLSLLGLLHPVLDRLEEGLPRAFVGRVHERLDVGRGSVLRNLAIPVLLRVLQRTQVNRLLYKVKHRSIAAELGVGHLSDADVLALLDVDCIAAEFSPILIELSLEEVAIGQLQFKVVFHDQ